MQETLVWSLCREDLLEKETATHSSILAWEIPRTEEPGSLQSTGSQQVGRDLGSKQQQQQQIIFYQAVLASERENEIRLLSN